MIQSVINVLNSALTWFFGEAIMADTFYRFFIDLSVFAFVFMLFFGIIYVPCLFLFRLLGRFGK